MRNFMKASLAAGASALAMSSVGPHAAIAADMLYPQGQYEGPPSEAYSSPPAEESYGYPPPPSTAYGYPPPPSFAYSYPPPAPYYEYAPPPYLVVPGPYYSRGPYWRGYPPRYAYGYDHWGHGYRRW